VAALRKKEKILREGALRRAAGSQRVVVIEEGKTSIERKKTRRK